MAALLGLWGCAGSPAPGQVLEVDSAEDGVVVVSDRAGGPPLRVRSTALPHGAREGDVIVDGRVDRELTSELREDVRLARGRLRRVEHGGSLQLEEEAGEAPPRAPGAGTGPAPAAGAPDSNR